VWVVQRMVPVTEAATWEHLTRSPQEPAWGRPMEAVDQTGNFQEHWTANVLPHHLRLALTDHCRAGIGPVLP